MTAITSITGSNTGDIYFSSSIGGAYRFKFGKVPRSYYIEELSFDMPISCVYISSNDLVWLGTNGYGVEFSNPEYTDFNLMNYISREDFKVVSIRAFHEDNTHYWVGGYDGLVKISRIFVPSNTLKYQMCTLLLLIHPIQICFGSDLKVQDFYC